jgi:hypothetical protein
MKTFLTMMLVSLVLLSQTACYEVAQEGELKIQVIRGQIAHIIKPSDGWFSTLDTFGDDYYPFNTRVFTFPVQVNGSTKDNAAVKVDISATLFPPSDDDGIKAFVRKFGLDESERWNRMTSILGGQMNTEAKNGIANYEAYALLANQEALQKGLETTLKPILKELTGLTLQSVQIIGRPDFADDRIEEAASKVVANGKLKEAAEAALAAAKVDAEQKQVQAQTFANPAMLQIKMLELRLAIEQARAEGIAKHQGTLILGNSDSQLQLQLQNNK